MVHSNSRQTEIERMEADIRKLARKVRGDDSDDEPTKKRQKKSYLAEEMAKYTNSRGVHKKGKGKDGKRKDEGDVLAALSSFRSKLKTVAPGPEATDPDVDASGPSEQPPAKGEEDPGMEVDDDVGFLSHHLYFPKDNSEEVMKAERDYEVIDPRQRGARAKEEERERKRAIRPKDGGRGARRH